MLVTEQDIGDMVGRVAVELGGSVCVDDVDGKRVYRIELEDGRKCNLGVWAEPHPTFGQEALRSFSRLLKHELQMLKKHGKCPSGHTSAVRP